jgi:hypothetical protein
MFSAFRFLERKSALCVKCGCYLDRPLCMPSSKLCELLIKIIIVTSKGSLSFTVSEKLHDFPHPSTPEGSRPEVYQVGCVK